MSVMPEGVPEPRKLGKRKARDVALNQLLPSTELQLRMMKAMRMRERGYTLDRIAADLGYKSVASVRELLRRAVHMVTVAEAEDFARNIIQGYVHDFEMVQSVIDDPGYLHDVKGDLLTGPTGRYERNLDLRVKALTEKRHLAESVRRHLGMDAPVKKHITVEAQARQDLAQKLILELRQAPPQIEPGTGAFADGYYADVVEAEILGDEEGSSESDEAAGESPGQPDAMPGRSESRQQEQDDRGDEQDNAER